MGGDRTGSYSIESTEASTSDHSTDANLWAQAYSDWSNERCLSGQHASQSAEALKVSFLPELLLHDAKSSSAEDVVASYTSYVGEFGRVMKNNFQKVDADRDGFVSEKELERAFADKSIPVQDRMLMTILYENLRGISDLSNDEWGRETSGATMDDLNRLDNLERETAIHYLTGRYGEEHFTELDADKSGFISRDELKKAIEKSGSKNAAPEDKAMLEVLLNRFDQVADSPGKGIAMKDLREYSSHVSDDVFDMVLALKVLTEVKLQKLKDEHPR